MKKNWPSMQRRWRGALVTSIFGAVVTGPLEFLDSGMNWGVLFAVLIGAGAGAVTGFIFPSLLARHRKDRKENTTLFPPPPPPFPPPPAPPRPPE